MVLENENIIIELADRSVMKVAWETSETKYEVVQMLERETELIISTLVI